GAFPNIPMHMQRVRDALDPFEKLGLQLLQYSAETSRLIPLLVTRAAVGDHEPLQSAINQVRQELIPRLTLGLNLAVFCSEDVPFVSFQGVDAHSVLRLEYQRACRGWPRTELPDDFRASVRLDRPTLLISGEWDPVTSPRWARVAADQFSRSQVVVVAKEGHTLDGLDS